MEAVLRARTLSETRGFLKALVEPNGDRILGFTAFAVDGGEIMSSVQIAMIAGLPYTAFRNAILAHPTLRRGLRGCSRRNLCRDKCRGGNESALALVTHPKSDEL